MSNRDINMEQKEDIEATLFDDMDFTAEAPLFDDDMSAPIFGDDDVEAPLFGLEDNIENADIFFNCPIENESFDMGQEQLSEQIYHLEEEAKVEGQEDRENQPSLQPSKKIQQKGSKFKLNLQNKSRQIISSSEDETGGTSSARKPKYQKEAYKRPAQVSTASGPFAMGPSSLKASTLPSVQVKSETMGFDMVQTKSFKSKNQSNSIKVKQESKPKKPNNNPIPEQPAKVQSEPLHQAMVSEGTDDDEEYLNIDTKNPTMPVQIDTMQCEDTHENPLYLFQFPTSLVYTSSRQSTPIEASSENEKAGKLGKLYILKNGTTILKVGKIIYKVAEGMLGNYVQNVSCLNVDSGKMYSLGGIEKKYVCSPDIDMLLGTH